MATHGSPPGTPGQGDTLLTWYGKRYDSDDRITGSPRAYALFNSRDFFAGNLIKAINSVALAASQ
jgi:hypothetical protein